MQFRLWTIKSFSYIGISPSPASPSISWIFSLSPILFWGMSCRMLFLARNQWDKKGEMAMDQTIPHTFSRICLENNAHLSASFVVNDGGIKRNEGLIFLTIIKRKLQLIGKIYGGNPFSRGWGRKGARDHFLKLWPSLVGGQLVKVIRDAGKCRKGGKTLKKEQGNWTKHNKRLLREKIGFMHA